MQKVLIPVGFRNDTIYMFRNERGGTIQIIQIEHLQNDYAFERRAREFFENLVDKENTRAVTKSASQMFLHTQQDGWEELSCVGDTTRDKKRLAAMLWLVQPFCESCIQINITEPKSGGSVQSVFEEMHASLKILQQPTD